MKDKKNKSKNYFDETTEKFIVKFQKEKKVEKQKKIFHEKIRPAFEKLIENIIFVYKFKSLENIDVLQNDCLSYLFEKLRLFDVTRGFKAFSYFNVIAKHWFLQEVKIRKKKIKCDVSLSKELIENSEDKESFVIQSFEEDLVNYEFLELLKKEMKYWLTKVKNDQERNVLSAIILLFNEPDLVQVFNKKGIFIYVREITKLNGKQIASNFIKFRKKYNIFKKRFLSGEI